MEQDVERTQRESDAEIESHAAFSLARGERRADDGQNERGERHGDALVVFHLVAHDVAAAASDLFRDEIAQFGARECLLLTLGIDQVGRFHHDDGVFVDAAGDVLSKTFQLADFPVRRPPLEFRVGNRVVLNFLSCG